MKFFKYIKIKIKYTICTSHVKNVAWILMKISCLFMSQMDGSLVKIDTKFHDVSMSFISVLFFSMLEHDMDFVQVQVTEFPGHLLRK